MDAQEEERLILLCKLDLLKRAYPEIFIPDNIKIAPIDTLRCQYEIAVNNVQKAPKSQKWIEDTLYHYNSASLISLEIICCKINDPVIKKYISDLQMYFNLTIDVISNNIFPIENYCYTIYPNIDILNHQYVNASIIYWFITEGPLIKYRYMILDNIKDEHPLIDIINAIDYIPIKSAID